MDEEQPKKKITLNNFFEQIVEIDKVANAALTNSNVVQSQLNAVQLDLKRLIESLQVNFDSGVQNVQTQVNEVTNVIVQEQEIKKSETDALEEQIFAQEDQLQKQVKSKKTISSDGNLIQKAISSIENKAKSNLLAAGLFGGSFLLAGLKSPELPELDKKDEDKISPSNKSVFDTLTEGQKNRILNAPIGTNVEGVNVTEKIKFELRQYEKSNSEEIFPILNDTSNIINEKSDDVSEKQQLLITLEERKNEIDDEIKLNKELLLEKNVSSITAERKAIEESINNLKLNKKGNEFGGNDYLQKLIKDKNIKINSNKGITPFKDTSMGKGEKIKVTPFEDTSMGKNKVNVDGFGYNNFDTDIFKIKDDNTSNTVINGGTTIIEGNNEVVNENIGGGQPRGEVATDVSIVKSSYTPVSAVAIAEGNSLNHLTI